MSIDKKTIAIVTDDPGWHGSQLQGALTRRGYDSRFVSLQDCEFHFSTTDNDIELEGFDSLPSGAFIRGVPGGSLEQVIFRLDLLHAMEDYGIVIFNTPRALERTVDKPLTSLLIKRAGLPTPETWVCESLAKAQDIYTSQINKGKKLLLKPLFGSQGNGIHLLDESQGIVHDEYFSGVYYLQEFIQRDAKECSDIRVLVVDGKAVSAMTRRGIDWRTNRSQGGECISLKLTEQLKRLAEQAVEILNIDYAGVDLIQNDKGEYLVIEVNSIPAWYGLQGVTDFNIADCLIDSFIKRLEAK